MKPFSAMTLITLLFVFIFNSCSTESLDANLEDLEIGLEDTTDDGENGDDSDQLMNIVLTSDFDWSTIPDNYANRTWEIRYDFDLEDLSINLPSNVVLFFNGGALTNYTSIKGENTQIEEGISGSFDASGVLEGAWDLNEIYPEWFGALGDGISYDADSFIESIEFLDTMGGGNLMLTTGKDYVVDKEILLSSNIHIEGNGASISVPSTNWDGGIPHFYAIFTTVNLLERPESPPYAEFGTGEIKFYNIQIRNITFNLNRDGNVLALGTMRSSDFNAVRYVDAQDCIVENCTFLDKQTSAIWTLVAVLTFEKSNNCIARNNKFDKCGAISVSESEACIVDGNIVNDSPGTAIEMYIGSYHKVNNNTLNTQWYPASSIGCSSKYSVISNNIVNESNASGITMGHPDVDGYPSFGADYSSVINNYIKGGPVTAETGRIGILLQNGIGLKIMNNIILDLYKGTEYTINEAGIMVSGANTVEEQVKHDDLLVDGNRIINSTTGIHIRDMINVSITNNYIENVFRGIYGESDIANSPNAKMIINKNTIKDSGEALFLNCPYNLVTNNTITVTDALGYFHYGRYIFNNNTITEASIGPFSYHPISFTIRDNYFYNSMPLGNLAEGSIITMRAPQMEVEDLIIDGNVKDYPDSGRATTWLLRAYELKNHVGSQYFN